MATFKIQSKDLTGRAARSTTSKNSFLGTGIEYIDPLDDEIIELPDIAGGSSVLDHPSIAQRVERWEKDSVLRMKETGEVSTKIRDTRAKNGDPLEWDHLLVGFTRDQSAMLAEGGEELQQQVRSVIMDVINRSTKDPEAKRQMVVTPMHTNSDSYHIQFMVARFPVKRLETGEVEVQASYDVSRTSETKDTVEAINEALQEAGLNAFTIDQVGDYAPSRINPADRDETPSPEARRQVQPPENSLLSKYADITPDEQALKKAYDLEDRMIQKLQEQLAAAEERKRVIENTFAAEKKMREAEEARIAAEATAAAAIEAKEQAEATAKAALEAQEAAEKAEKEATATAEAAMEESEAFEAQLTEANTKIGDLEDSIVTLKDDHEEAIEAKNAVIAEMEETHQNEVGNLHQQIENMEKAHANKVAQIEQDHAAQVEALEADKQALSGQLSAMEQRAVKAEQEAQAVPELRQQLAQAKGEATAAKQVAEEQKTWFDQQIGKYEAKIEALQEKVAKANENARTIFEKLKGPIMEIINFRHKQRIDVKEDTKIIVAEAIKSGQMTMDDIVPPTDDYDGGGYNR